MIPIPAGRIETTTAQPLGEGSGKERSRFVFSDLENLDPEGRYKVIVHEWLPRGVPIPVQVSGAIQPIRFHLRSFQERFAVQKLDPETLFQSVLRAKVDLLKKRAKGKKDPEFEVLVDLLYQERGVLTTPCEKALKELSQYSEWAKKTVRLSAKWFGMQNSLTIQGSWVAIDVKKTLKTGQTKVKMAKLPDGQQVVRRITEPQARLIDTLTRFRNTPHVMPTLATARYVNSKGKEVFVSYHPFCRRNLGRFFKNNSSLPYENRIAVAGQILAGVEALHKEGTHGNLVEEKIFVDTKPEILIAGLESFAPHFVPSSGSSPGELQDVWQLGRLFCILFETKITHTLSFSRPLQEEIDAFIRGKGFPHPIALMLQGMLQVDRTKRWSLRQVIDYFEQEVIGEFGRLIAPLRENSISASALASMQTYAKKCQQTIRFSAGYFQLKQSATATPDLVAIDGRESICKKERTKIKTALLPDGTMIVRRIVEYNSKLVKILNLFPNTPHVLPTLGTARYINKKGLDILVSFHPYFALDLGDPLIERPISLSYGNQVRICHQIISGMEKIHEKGVHGDLKLGNILVTTTPHLDVVVADLEMFTPHGGSVEEWGPPIQAWSAPEVRVLPTPPPAAASHDVWSLGLIFHTLFQNGVRNLRLFQGSTQEQILADIEARKFPLPIAYMIYGMLQIDPAKRWTLEQVAKHFREKILLTPKSAPSSENPKN